MDEWRFVASVTIVFFNLYWHNRECFFYYYLLVDLLILLNWYALNVINHLWLLMLIFFRFHKAIKMKYISEKGILIPNDHFFIHMKTHPLATHKTYLLHWPEELRINETNHISSQKYRNILTTWKHSLKMKLHGLMLNTCLINANSAWTQREAFLSVFG